VIEKIVARKVARYNARGQVEEVLELRPDPAATAEALVLATLEALAAPERRAVAGPVRLTLRAPPEVYAEAGRRLRPLLAALETKWTRVDVYPGTDVTPVT